MTSRTLTLLAAAALAAAVPATAIAKPHGPHPGKGKGHGLERFDRGDRTGLLSDSSFAPLTDEAPAGEETADVKPSKHAKAERGHGRRKGKMTVFKGTVASTDTSAGTVTVRVRHRNRWARVFRGEEVTFSLETARILVADTDGDGTHGVSDIAVDDRVLVKARVARGAADDGSPIAALRLIDQTSPYEEDEDGEDDAAAPVVTEPEPETVPEV